MPFSSKQQGFSLIEVLVAFVILAMSLTVVYRIFSGGLRNVALSEDYARAVLIAESQLAVTGVTAQLEPGLSSGAWNQRFRWERVIEDYQPWERQKELTAPVLAYRITVNVDWEHAGRTRQITLNGIRLKHDQHPGTRG